MRQIFPPFQTNCRIFRGKRVLNPVSENSECVCLCVKREREREREREFKDLEFRVEGLVSVCGYVCVYECV